MNSGDQGIPVDFYEHVFDNASTSQSRWQPVSRSTGSTVCIDEFGIVTWNVWFNELEKQRRFQGFRKELFSFPNVDIVSLQEVTREFLGFLQEDVAIQSDWLMTDTWDISHEREIWPNSYGCIFMVKKKWTGNVRAWVRRFPTSKMGRFVIMAEIFQGDKSVVRRRSFFV